MKVEHSGSPSSEIGLQTLTPPVTPPPIPQPAPAKPHTGTEQPDASPSPEEIHPAQNSEPESPGYGEISKAKSTTMIGTLAGISFLNTMGSGILISALPRIGEDLGLSEGFLLWPASVYALAAGCLLLIFGAVADVVGAKRVWVTGSFFYMVFTVAVGLVSRSNFVSRLYVPFGACLIILALVTAHYILISAAILQFLRSINLHVEYLSDSVFPCSQGLGFK